MGLFKIWVLSALTGISISISYLISGETLQAGLSFTILNMLYENVGPRGQIFVLIISIIVTIIFIYGLSKFFREIYEQKLSGVITAFLGFFGSLLFLLSPQDTSYLIFLGIGFWIVGLIFSLVKKDKKLSKL